MLLAAQKDVGFDRVLQDGGGGADDGHQFRVDLTAQLGQHPAGQIHRRHKGQAVVQQCGQGSGFLTGEAAAHPRHPGADVTGGGHRQHSGCAAAHLHHLVMGDAQVLGAGGADRGGTAADGGQRSGGTLCQLFRFMIQAGEHGIHPGAGHAVQRLIVRQQVVEIITVALGAGHAARTGVGLFQQAQLCQRRHFIAKGGTGHSHVKVVGQHTAAHGLTFETIQRHDRLQNALFACIHRHSACLLFAWLFLFSTPCS